MDMAERALPPPVALSSECYPADDPAADAQLVDLSARRVGWDSVATPGGAPLPDIVRCSHLRVLLPDGMDDSELSFALRSYADVRWLEVDTADKAFCGWDTRMPGNPKRQSDFVEAADALLAPRARLRPARSWLDRQRGRDGRCAGTSERTGMVRK